MSQDEQSGGSSTSASEIAVVLAAIKELDTGIINLRSEVGQLRGEVGQLRDDVARLRNAQIDQELVYHSHMMATAFAGGASVMWRHPNTAPSSHFKARPKHIKHASISST